MHKIDTMLKLHDYLANTKLTQPIYYALLKELEHTIELGKGIHTRKQVAKLLHIHDAKLSQFVTYTKLLQQPESMKVSHRLNIDIGAIEKNIVEDITWTQL